MQQSDSFNTVTVDWQRPDLLIETGAAAECEISADHIADFKQDGVVLLKSRFTDWVDTLRAGLQRNLDNPSAYAFPCESNPQGLPGRFFDSYCNWQLIPEYLDFVQHSSAASMAGQLMNAQKAQFFHEHAFIKSAGTQRATPWHQDLPYYCVDGYKTASVYIALDKAESDVAVQFVKGSHQWGKLFHPRIFENGDNFNHELNQNMESVPELSELKSRGQITAWSLEPGDAIVFDFRTLHGTSDAQVKNLRRAFSTRWIGEDVTFCERPGEVSPPYVNHGMKHGDPMREDWFPVFWCRS